MSVKITLIDALNLLNKLSNLYLILLSMKESKPNDPSVEKFCKTVSDFKTNFKTLIENKSKNLTINDTIEIDTPYTPNEITTFIEKQIKALSDLQIIKEEEIKKNLSALFEIYKKIQEFIITEEHFINDCKDVSLKTPEFANTVWPFLAEIIKKTSPQQLEAIFKSSCENKNADHNLILISFEMIKGFSDYWDLEDLFEYDLAKHIHASENTFSLLISFYRILESEEFESLLNSLKNLINIYNEKFLPIKGIFLNTPSASTVTKNFFKDLEPQLVTPAQRVGRYDLFIRDISKNTALITLFPKVYSSIVKENSKATQLLEKVKEMNEFTENKAKKSSSTITDNTESARTLSKAKYLTEKNPKKKFSDQNFPKDLFQSQMTGAIANHLHKLEKLIFYKESILNRTITQEQTKGSAAKTQIKIINQIEVKMGGKTSGNVDPFIAELKEKIKEPKKVNNTSQQRKSLPNEIKVSVQDHEKNLKKIQLFQQLKKNLITLYNAMGEELSNRYTTDPLYGCYERETIKIEEMIKTITSGIKSKDQKLKAIIHWKQSCEEEPSFANTFGKILASILIVAVAIAFGVVIGGGLGMLAGAWSGVGAAGTTLVGGTIGAIAFGGIAMGYCKYAFFSSTPYEDAVCAVEDTATQYVNTVCPVKK